MKPATSLLDQLRQRTKVDCDTLDASVAESLGPFEDCTSNQAIAYFELVHTRHADLVQRSAQTAQRIHTKGRYTDIELQALAVEVCMIQLGLQVLPFLKGRIHIQANPFDAYSTARTVSGAERILALFQEIDQTVNAGRVCIKIPSTWEGLQACRILEAKGVNTLATTLFTLEQAAVAGQAGCHYIAPYVNELAVHFEKGFIDRNPNSDLCVQAQRYLATRSPHGHDKVKRTRVLPASLVSVAECMALAGADHITLAPALLSALSESQPRSESKSQSGSGPKSQSGSEAKSQSGSNPEPTSQSGCNDDGTSSSPASREATKSLFDADSGERDGDTFDTLEDLIDDESRFRILFTRNDSGRQEIKQVKAINVFADMQVELEKLVSRYL